MFDPYVTCARCGGDGYQHLFGPLYLHPCRGCNGTGIRERALTRIWRAVRHGARHVTDGDY